jgi:regulatory protein
MPPKSDVDRLRNYFLFLLGKRDYSSGILREKALRKGYENTLVSEVITELEGYNYINDTRYGEQMIEQYRGRKGKQYMSMKLVQKKIPRDIIESVLSEEEAEPLAPNTQFYQQVIRKYQLTNETIKDPKIKSKVIAFIARQGFGGVWEIYSEIEQIVLENT